MSSHFSTIQHVSRCLLAIFLLMGLLTASAVQAQEAATPEGDPAAGLDVRFGVRPAGGQDLEIFRTEIEPGGSTTLHAEIVNMATSSVELDVLPANAISKVNGGFALDTSETELTPPATWMALAPATISLQPDEVIALDVPVEVPADAGPGQYVTGFAVRTSSSYAVGDSEMFRQVIQKYAAIVITVPGPVESSFTLGDPQLDAQRGQVAITIPVHNTGNVLVTPSGELTIATESGVVLISGPVQMQQVYMGHSTEMLLSLGTSLPPGEYLLTLELADSRNGGSSASLVDVPITVVQQPEMVPDDPVTFTTVTIEPNADPVQFIAVAADVQNTGDAHTATRVTLVVARDGEHIEDFIVADNVPLPRGTSTFSQRYITLEGFQAGTWTFTLKIEAVGSDGLATLLQSTDAVTIEVP